MIISSFHSDSAFQSPRFEQRCLPSAIPFLSCHLTAASELGVSWHQGHPKEKPLHQRGVRPQWGLCSTHASSPGQHHAEPPREWWRVGGGNGRGFQWGKLQRRGVFIRGRHGWRVLQRQQTADRGRQQQQRELWGDEESVAWWESGAVILSVGGCGGAGGQFGWKPGLLAQTKVFSQANRTSFYLLLEHQFIRTWIKSSNVSLSSKAGRVHQGEGQSEKDKATRPDPNISGWSFQSAPGCWKCLEEKGNF